MGINSGFKGLIYEIVIFNGNFFVISKPPFVFKACAGTNFIL